MLSRQQIAQIYDSFTEDQKDLPKEQFIKRVSEATNPDKMAQEANMIAAGRIRRKQIGQALRGGHA